MTRGTLEKGFADKDLMMHLTPLVCMKRTYAGHFFLLFFCFSAALF